MLLNYKVLRMINVLIYEDNDSLRNTLQLLVQSDSALQLIGAHPNCDAIDQHITTGVLPDVILMDIDMPGIGGIEGVKNAKAILPDVQIIMFTVFEDEDRLFECLMAGATGYILKKNKASEILLAIKDVFSGGIPITPEIARKVIGVFKTEKPPVQHNLTERELELLKMLSFGRTYKNIAAELSISIETVRSHLKNIYMKMHVASGTEAVAKGLRMRIIK